MSNPMKGTSKPFKGSLSKGNVKGLSLYILDFQTHASSKLSKLKNKTPHPQYFFHSTNQKHPTLYRVHSCFLGVAWPPLFYAAIKGDGVWGIVRMFKIGMCGKVRYSGSHEDFYLTNWLLPPPGSCQEETYHSWWKPHQQSSKCLKETVNATNSFSHK